jgi:photosystem II stability/assembly factor-like uncharacterized protein
MKNSIVAVMILLMALIIGCQKTENIADTNSTNGQWTLVREAQSDSHFYALTFADQNNGWAIGDFGRISHSSDGGNTWNDQTRGTIASLKSVFFVNNKVGWIGGGSNTIGSTTDGGTTWIWQHPASEPHRTFMSMSFVDEHIGWIIDNFGGILHTKDGGTTWTPQVSGTTWAITSVQFLDALEGWAISTNAEVLHTIDGGAHWMKKDLASVHIGSGVAVVYDDIFFFNRSKGWIATNALVSSVANATAPVVSTSDAGETWTAQSSKEPWMRSIQFVDESNGWAAGMNGILHTDNAGATWAYQLQDPQAIFVDICFIDQSHGWVITFEGRIYKYVPTVE